MAKASKKNQEMFLIKLDQANYNAPAISKKTAMSAAYKIHNDIVEGNASAVQMAEMFKFVEEVKDSIKEITDDNGKNSFTDLVREEIARNSDDGKSCNSKNGTKFELSETGVKYDYTVCNDPQWNYYDEQMKELKKKQEKRQKFLLTIEATYPVGNVLVSETGELHENVELNPPSKTSTSSYKQTLFKGE